jgi:hypothetical protein
MNAVSIEELDEIDQGILEDRMRRRAEIKGPRIGDIIEFADGRIRLISHVWLDRVQSSDGGSLYLRKDGEMDFSGTLFHGVDIDALIRVMRPAAVRCWIFHHDEMRAGNGIEVRVAARVYRSPENAP